MYLLLSVLQSSIEKTKCPRPEDFEVEIENEDDLEAQRIGMALSHCGVSITLTSLSSVIAFLIGSFADIPAITSFCMYSALSFAANYITQFLIYVPIIILDEKRIKQQKNCLCCCYKHKKSNPNYQSYEIDFEGSNSNNHNKNFSSSSKNDHESKNELKTTKMKGYSALDSNTGYEQIDSSTWFNSNTATTAQSGGAATNETNGRIRTSNKNNGQDKIVRWLFDHIIIPLHQRRLCRWLIIVIFLCMCGVSIYSFQFLDTSADNARYVPDDSFALKYLSYSEKAFDDEMLSTGYIIMLNQNFADNEIRNDTLNFISQFENGNYSSSKYGHVIGDVDHWLFEYETYLMDKLGINSYQDFFNLYNESMFYYYLQQFTNDSDYSSYKEWQTEIIYNDITNPTKIQATRWTVDVAKSTDMNYIWDVRQQWNKILRDNYNSDHDDAGFIFEETFGISYVVTVVFDLTTQSVLFAGIGVFLVLLFVIDLRLAIFCVIVIFMIDIDLIGWMVLFNISLDSLAYVTLVIAVGLTVDYVLHVSHAIAIAGIKLDNDLKNYNSRIVIAMDDMGIDVCKGALTTLAGVIPLYFSQSEAFRIFFFMFCGIVLIAILHGLLFVPAILGEIPCIYYGDGHNKLKLRETKQETRFKIKMAIGGNTNDAKSDVSGVTGMTDMTALKSNNESGNGNKHVSYNDSYD